MTATEKGFLFVVGWLFFERMVGVSHSLSDAQLLPKLLTIVSLPGLHLTSMCFLLLASLELAHVPHLSQAEKLFSSYGFL